MARTNLKIAAIQLILRKSCPFEMQLILSITLLTFSKCTFDIVFV